MTERLPTQSSRAVISAASRSPASSDFGMSIRSNTTPRVRGSADPLASSPKSFRVEGPHPVLLERRQFGERAHPYGHVHRQHRAAPRNGRRTPGHSAGSDCAGGL
jgi:hypothetical protein